MTEQQLREKVVSIMESWLGYNEANGKFKQILEIYNNHKPLPRGVKMLTSYEWCAATVSAAFIKAGLADIGFKECSCSRMIELYKAKGRWMERDDYKAKVGDVVMYYWKDGANYATTDCTAMPNHVGIVKSINGNDMIIIEGNKGEKVDTRPLKVNGRYIRGYCLPDYASKATHTITSTLVHGSSEPEEKPKEKLKADPAKSFNRAYAKTYTVTASALNMRTKAATKIGNKDVPIIKVLPNGSKVTCYGYYTQNGASVWLYVKDKDGDVGFCSKKHLK